MLAGLRSRIKNKLSAKKAANSKPFHNPSNLNPPAIKIKARG
jgi:hypothetical protein